MKNPFKITDNIARDLQVGLRLLVTATLVFGILVGIGLLALIAIAF